MSHILEVLNAPQNEVGSLIREKVKDSQRVQEETLLDIVDINKDTDFGRAHNFSEIESIEDFRNLVPISEYDDYLDDVEKLKNGTEDVLFPGKTQQFILTSGTTGTVKFIPHSKLSKQLLDHTTLTRTKEIDREIPETSREHTLTITNFSQYLKTEGNVSAGSASGVSSKLQAENPNIVPPLVLTTAGVEDIKRIDSIDYITILFGVNDDSIYGFAGNDSSYLVHLFKILNDNFEKIIKDIREGTISVEISDSLRKKLEDKLIPNPQRADELEKIYEEKGELKPEDVWPHFKYVVGWLSSSMGRLVEEFSEIFPEGTEFFDAGYGASEGKFNIPIRINAKSGLPVVYGFFFEFLPLDSDQPVLINETKEGEFYELIITSYNGLYRYNMKDLVEVSKEDGLYEIEFIGKSKDNAEIDGVTIYGSDINSIIENYENDHDVFISHIEGIPMEDELVLRIEPRDEIDREEFNKYLEKELDKKGIKLNKVDYLEKGYRDTLKEKKVMDNLNRSQIKFMVFDPERYPEVLD